MAVGKLVVFLLPTQIWHNNSDEIITTAATATPKPITVINGATSLTTMVVGRKSRIQHGQRFPELAFGNQYRPECFDFYWKM